MAWEALDRRTPVIDEKAAPLLSEAVREKIRSFFPRYETKRAVLLPALHVVQDALGHVGWQAMKEVAELLEIPPAQVFDTISFYTHFWTHAKGRKVIVLCRSLSCQLMGADAVQQAVQRQLGIGEHETTDDGEYSFVTEECLAACDHGPCMLINEKMHRNVRAADVPRLLADANNATLSIPRSTLFDAPTATDAADELETTSDVREMKES
ncbi:MAG: NAD(P)H-dependent oxidoreductase subunit E [Phycisphaerae bacterium]|nr:NAD(P)H-dependent oxidoreductase subunit E [Phycisphaerae bacterium]NUQ46887.1 NAD(P)H-dependent oxidoreductase subunit E [Phycisphaerae bacterium]